MEEISRGCASHGVIMSVNNSLYCDPVYRCPEDRSLYQLRKSARFDASLLTQKRERGAEGDLPAALRLRREAGLLRAVRSSRLAMPFSPSGPLPALAMPWSARPFARIERSRSGRSRRCASRIFGEAEGYSPVSWSAAADGVGWGPLEPANRSGRRRRL